jgi:hypothetical protein
MAFAAFFLAYACDRCVYLVYYCTLPNLLLRLVIQVLKAFAAFFRASVGSDRSVPASSEAGKNKKMPTPPIHTNMSTNILIY